MSVERIRELIKMEKRAIQFNRLYFEGQEPPPIIEAHEYIISLLEKEIPKKPIEREMCANCGGFIDSGEYQPNRCEICGQVLDWGQDL